MSEQPHNSSSSDPSAAKLIFSSGASPDVYLKGERVTIGRTKENDIALDDPSVSSSHAELVSVHGRWVLRDLGSSNGTTVNGQPIAEARMKNGDEVCFASAACRFEAPQIQPLQKAFRHRRLVVVIALVAVLILGGVLLVQNRRHSNPMQNAMGEQVTAGQRKSAFVDSLVAEVKSPKGGYDDPVTNMELYLVQFDRPTTPISEVRVRPHLYAVRLTNIRGVLSARLDGEKTFRLVDGEHAITIAFDKLKPAERERIMKAPVDCGLRVQITGYAVERDGSFSAIGSGYPDVADALRQQLKTAPKALIASVQKEPEAEQDDDPVTERLAMPLRVSMGDLDPMRLARSPNQELVKRSCSLKVSFRWVKALFSDVRWEKDQRPSVIPALPGSVSWIGYAGSRRCVNLVTVGEEVHFALFDQPPLASNNRYRDMKEVFADDAEWDLVPRQFQFEHASTRVRRDGGAAIKIKDSERWTGTVISQQYGALLERK